MRHILHIDFMYCNVRAQFTHCKSYIFVAFAISIDNSDNIFAKILFTNVFCVLFCCCLIHCVSVCVRICSTYFVRFYIERKRLKLKLPANIFTRFNKMSMTELANDKDNRKTLTISLRFISIPFDMNYSNFYHKCIYIIRLFHYGYTCRDLFQPTYYMSVAGAYQLSFIHTYTQ